MSNTLSRRRAVTLLTAGLAAACAKKGSALGPLPGGPLLLGWRWVPGHEYIYKTVVEHHQSGALTSRAEEWTYLVRTLSPNNVALLEGRLTGFGAGERNIEHQSSAITAAIAKEKQRITKAASLEITMNGRITSPVTTDFEHFLPHQMLEFALPTTPIAPEEKWASDQVMVPFIDILPPGLRTTHWAHSRIVKIGHESDIVSVHIETSGAVHTENGERFLGLQGLTVWNAEHGHLRERTLKVHLPELEGSHSIDAGELHIKTQLV
jgi:hypothetical protein